MTDEQNDEALEPSSKGAGEPNADTAKLIFARMPGLIAIGLYMLLLACTVIWGVVNRSYPPLYLIFPMLFFAAGFGLLMLFRWAWALTLGAVTLMMAMSLYQIVSGHSGISVMQAIISLAFFLYLVRPEVRIKLR